MRDKVLRALGWAFGAKFLSQIFNWAITLLVIRLLSPNDYGLLALAMVVVQIATVVSELGIGSAIVQRATVDTAFLRQVVGFNLTLAIVMCVSLLLSSTLLGNLLGESDVSQILQLLAFTFPLAALGVVPKALLTRAMDFRYQSIVQATASILSGLTTLWLAVRGHGVYALVWGHLIATTLYSLGLWFRKSARLLPARYTFRKIADVIKYGLGLTTEHLVWSLAGQIDILLIGRILGKEMLGLYSVGMNLARLPQSKVQSTLNQVAFAGFTHALRDGDNHKYYLEKYLRIATLVSTPVFFGISLVAEPLVLVALGEKWRGSIIPLEIVSIAIPLSVIDATIATYLHALGRVRVALVNMFVFLCIITTFVAIGIYLADLKGAAFGWAIGYLITECVIVLRLPRATSVNSKAIFAIVLHAATPAILMYALTRMAQWYFPVESGLVAGLLTILFGMVVYSVFAMSFCRSQLMEVAALFGLNLRRR